MSREIIQEAPTGRPGWSVILFHDTTLAGKDVYLVARGTRTGSFGDMISPILFRSLDEDKARAFANKTWKADRAAAQA